MISRWTPRILGLVAALLVAALPVSAGSITLKWNPGANAAGYRLYLGSSPGQYDRFINVGNVTQYTINDVGDCTESYYAVTAINGLGESDRSNEVLSWPEPEIDSVTPSMAKQGEQFTLDIEGNNFQSAAEVSIDNPRVVLTNPSNTCSRIQLAATVEPGTPGLRAAEVGTFNLRVVHPEFSDSNRDFEVLVEPARFDLDDRDAVGSADKLDGWDTILLSHYFSAQEGQSLYNVDADINGDGWVDGSDLAYIASFLGQCYTPQTEWQPTCPQSPN